METNDIVMSGLQMKKLMGRKVGPIIEEYDLRPVEVDILTFLYKEKEIDTAKELIQKMHLSKAHVSKSIDNLRKKGFLQVQEDENDRRVLHLKLTKKSEEIVEKVKGVRDECEYILQRNMSSEELEILNRLIQKMNQNINDELGE